MLNVLLIEDDEVDVMNVHRAFKKNNFPCLLTVARDSLEALEVLQANPSLPRRLILLDLHMPMMDGLAFLKVLRADPIFKSLPVVILTNSAAEHDRIEAYKLNVAGYIIKPVTFSDFVEVTATLGNYWRLNQLA